MKALQNHIILYDAECPMCKLYTQAFIQTGMLDEAGRATYQHMPNEVCPVVDRQRAVDEIALVDTQTGKITYGVDSIFKVLKPLFRFAPFVWLMRKAYAFVSYNRRVIIPANNMQSNALQPTFRLRYRLLYLAFTWVIVGAVLTQFAHYLTGVIPAGNAYREYLICGGQIVFQGITISRYAPAKMWEYLGNMMTISLGGALLLLPVMWMAQLFTFSPVICSIVFMAVAGLMFLEHIRRARLLRLGWLLTISWVVYRLLVLLIIL